MCRLLSDTSLIIIFCILLLVYRGHGVLEDIKSSSSQKLFHLGFLHLLVYLLRNNLGKTVFHFGRSYWINTKLRD